MRALTQAVDASGVYPARRHFASTGTVVDDYEVFVIAGVQEDVLDSVTHLVGDTFDGMAVAPSLAHQVIKTVLATASTALYLPDPGIDVRLLDRSTFDIIRNAGSYLAATCSVRSGNPFGSDLFDQLNDVTAQRYERSEATGRVLIARHDHPAVTTYVSFENTVHHGSTRAVRKLLEMTGPDVALLSDGYEIYGLGAVEDSYDAANQDLFEVHVPSHAVWELRHADSNLMRVTFGKATLPEAKVDRRAYDDAMQRIFAALEPGHLDRVWRLVDAAIAAPHGTMLVVSGTAASEAHRLAGQATLIEPVQVTEELVQRITSIDGAVLVDPQGICHAIGVILDGTASSTGDPARGARYNSAIRYLAGKESHTVIVIVSEDGGVNLLPQLKPRIRRERVGAALDRLKALGGPGADREAFNRAWEEVETVAFYMSQAQCDDANRLRDEVEQSTLAAGGISIIFDRLAPSDRMDETHFID